VIDVSDDGDIADVRALGRGATNLSRPAGRRARL